MAADLFDFAHSGATEPNILLFVLIDPGARALFGEAWADEAQRMVTQFRGPRSLGGGRGLPRPPRSSTLRPPAVRGVVEGTRCAAAGRGARCSTTRNGAGLSFAYATFQANDDPALKLAIYVPLDDA